MHPLSSEWWAYPLSYATHIYARSWSCSGANGGWYFSQPGWLHYWLLPPLLESTEGWSSGNCRRIEGKKWILPALNATHLALIPKEIGASHPGKFHPISLCNVIYKIISKVVANRLKPLLPLLISPEKSGYVEGRQILDGIILAHEVVKYLKTSKIPWMILKLDLSKSFDKLS